MELTFHELSSPSWVWEARCYIVFVGRGKLENMSSDTKKKRCFGRTPRNDKRRFLSR